MPTTKGELSLVSNYLTNGPFLSTWGFSAWIAREIRWIIQTVKLMISTSANQPCRNTEQLSPVQEFRRPWLIMPRYFLTHKPLSSLNYRPDNIWSHYSKLRPKSRAAAILLDTVHEPVVRFNIIIIHLLPSVVWRTKLWYYLSHQSNRSNKNHDISFPYKIGSSRYNRFRSSPNFATLKGTSDSRVSHHFLH